MKRRKTGQRKFGCRLFFFVQTGDTVGQIDDVDARVNQGKHCGQNAAFGHDTCDDNAVCLFCGGEDLRNGKRGVYALGVKRILF